MIMIFIVWKTYCRAKEQQLTVHYLIVFLFTLHVHFKLFPGRRVDHFWWPQEENWNFWILRYWSQLSLDKFSFSFNWYNCFSIRFDGSVLPASPNPYPVPDQHLVEFWYIVLDKPPKDPTLSKTEHSRSIYPVPHSLFLSKGHANHTLNSGTYR